MEELYSSKDAAPLPIFENRSIITAKLDGKTSDLDQFTLARTTEL